MYCPSCGGTDIKGAGFSYTLLEVKRKWRCRTCLKQWVEIGASRFPLNLQRSFTREIAGKKGEKYSKYEIGIPNATIELLGWRSGDALQGRMTKEGLFIRKMTRPQLALKRITYNDFRESVLGVLKSTQPNGLRWSELRGKIGLPQTSPSALWVKRLEDDGVLKRIKDKASGIRMWYLNTRKVK